MAVQDYTTYTEVDPSSDFTVTTDRIDVDSCLSRSTLQAYIYKDFGEAYFKGDEDFKCNLTITNAHGGTTAQQYSLMYIAGFTNNVDTIYDERSNNKLAVNAYQNEVGSWSILAREYNSGVQGGNDQATGLTNGATYYLTVFKDADVGSYGTVYVYIYSDANRTTLVDTLTATLSERHDFRYFYVASTFNDNGWATQNWYGVISNHDIILPEEERPATTTTKIIRSKKYTHKPPRGVVLNKTHSLSRGLIGCWLFNEGSGTQLTDYSGSNNHGTLTSMDPSTDWVAGLKGTALDFDGSNDYVLMNDPVKFSDPNVLTVITSVYTAEEPDKRVTIIGHNNESSVFQFELYLAGGNNCHVDVIIPGFYVVTTDIFDWPDPGEWRQFAYSRSGSGAGTHKVWMEGELMSLDVDNANSFSQATNATEFGRRASASQLWTGQIGYIYIYDRVLEDEEIKALYLNPYQIFTRSVVTLKNRYPKTSMVIS